MPILLLLLLPLHSSQYWIHVLLVLLLLPFP
jgi:hypothetical protein